MILDLTKIFEVPENIVFKVYNEKEDYYLDGQFKIEDNVLLERVNEKDKWKKCKKPLSYFLKEYLTTFQGCITEDEKKFLNIFKYLEIPMQITKIDNKLLCYVSGFTFEIQNISNNNHTLEFKDMREKCMVQLYSLLEHPYNEAFGRHLDKSLKNKKENEM